MYNSGLFMRNDTREPWSHFLLLGITEKVPAESPLNQLLSAAASNFRFFAAGSISSMP